MIKKDIFFVGDGFYKGNLIIIDWVSENKNITSNDKKFKQASGVLIRNKKRINVIWEFLYKKINYKEVDKVTLIKFCLKGDKKAKIEYIKRYKKSFKVK